MTEIVGWASSMVLLVTIGYQVYKRWKTHDSDGVSKWLFAGQVAASTGFTVYSLLVRNWVFVVTNAALLLSALCGFFIVLHHRRRNAQLELEDRSRHRRAVAA